MNIDRRGVTAAIAGGVFAAGAAKAQGPSAANARGIDSASLRSLRLIATEEAYASESQVAAMRRIGTALNSDLDLDMWKMKYQSLDSENGYSPTMRRLMDIGPDRIKSMDDAGIAMQVLSLTAPGVQMFAPDVATAVARESNDELAEAVKRFPGRYAGLASFAPQDVAGAVKEIERAMNTLKLNGLIVNSHTNGEYLDAQKYWPILEAAEALDAAIYIHPRNPPVHIQETLDMPGRAIGLNGAMWGFGLETSLHAMRLIMSGVFDRFPKLKIVLGHLGEGIPIWLFRMDQRVKVRTRSGGTVAGASLQKTPADYFRDNFLITTSGVFWPEGLEFVRNVISADNIMFAIDYPYEDSAEAANFMRTLDMPLEDIKKMSHQNAEKIFHIAAG